MPSLIGYEDVNWITIAHIIFQRCTLLNTVINLRVMKNSSPYYLNIPAANSIIISRLIYSTASQIESMASYSIFGAEIHLLLFISS